MSKNKNITYQTMDAAKVVLKGDFLVVLGF
jgi:hypothetical protein